MSDKELKETDDLMCKDCDDYYPNNAWKSTEGMCFKKGTRSFGGQVFNSMYCAFRQFPKHVREA